MKLTALVVGFLISFSGMGGTPTATKKEKQQIQCIATAVYFEARGASDRGKASVGQVIRNRVNQKKFPKTFCSVVYQQGQFSWSRSKKLKITDMDSWNKAQDIAKVTYYLGWPKSLIGDATYFYSGKRPYWAKGMTRVAHYDGNTFLTES